MIYYTLTGPTHYLEIYADKICLKKKAWLRLFSSNDSTLTWQISSLDQFAVTVPKFLFISGKIQWSCFSGEMGAFRFNTTPQMVKKIETYLQKRVIKNHQQQQRPSLAPLPLKKGPEESFPKAA